MCGLMYIKTKDEVLKDRPILTDDGKLLVNMNGKVYEIKVGEKGEFKYYETGVSNVQRDY